MSVTYGKVVSHTTFVEVGHNTNHFLLSWTWFADGGNPSRKESNWRDESYQGQLLGKCATCKQLPEHSCQWKSMSLAPSLSNLFT